jgi:hypothetical protein
MNLGIVWTFITFINQLIKRQQWTEDSVALNNPEYVIEPQDKDIPWW